MKSIASILLAASVLGACIPSATAAEDTAPIFKRLSKVTTQLEADGNQIVFARVKYLERDSHSGYALELIKGSTYTAWALGDEGRVNLLDLIVTDANKNEVAKHETESNAATVTFSPNATGDYSFTIKAGHINKKFFDGMVALVIARSTNGASKVDSAAIYSSTARILASSSTANNDLYGTEICELLRGETLTMGNGFGNKHEFTVTAIGDGERVMDLDIIVKDEDGNTVASDESDSNTGVVKFAPKNPGRFKIIVKTGAWKKNAPSGHFAIVIMSSRKPEAQPVASK